MNPRNALRARAHHRGLHGHRHIDRQRLISLLMIGSGLLRVFVWFLLLVTYLAHVATVRSLYASVSFVALLSVLALLLTDWGQVAASLAQLAAADSHHDAEAARREIGMDTRTLEQDISRLAQLKPGPECDAIVFSIRERLHG